MKLERRAQNEEWRNTDFNVLRSAFCVLTSSESDAMAVALRITEEASVNPLLLAFRQVPTLGNALVGQPALAVERGLAAAAGGGDGLAVDMVDGVAAGKDALD